MNQQVIVDPIGIWVTLATTILAAVSSSVFVALYMRFKWNESTPGRVIMAFAVSISIRAWIAVVDRWDDYHEEVTLTNITWPFIAISWLIIAGVFIWCLRALCRENHA